jgi:hypothetical protein
MAERSPGHDEEETILFRRRRFRPEPVSSRYAKTASKYKFL